ncbi:unnamed protein product, partial [marine sediment metagenome]
AGFGTVVLRSELTDGKKIGLLVPQYGSVEIFEPICSAIREESSNHFWQVDLPTELLDSRDKKRTSELFCAKFIREKFDGVFFSPSNRVEDNVDFNLGILDRLQKAGIKVVLIDREIVNWPNQTACDLVAVDNILAGLKVCEHMLKQGCKKIAFAKHTTSSTMIDLRIIGARQAIHQQNLPPEMLTIIEMDEQHNPEEIIKQGPCGLICANDEMAADLMRKLLDNGIRIPGDLKVAGFDDVKYAEFLSVPLTSYRQPCEEIGRIAVHTILTRFAHPEFASIRVNLQGDLVTRFSTSIQ